MSSLPTITFTKADLTTNHNENDPMMVTVTIANYQVKRILISQGNLTNILYWSTFQKLNLPDSLVMSNSEPLVEFTGKQVQTRGCVDLLTTFGTGPAYRTLTVRYILVEADLPYNAIIGRRTLNELGAVVSVYHMAMKFPAEDDTIITLKADSSTANIKREV